MTGLRPPVTKKRVGTVVSVFQVIVVTGRVGSSPKLALGFEPFGRAANGLLEFRKKRPIELIDDDH